MRINRLVNMDSYSLNVRSHVGQFDSNLFRYSVATAHFELDAAFNVESFEIAERFADAPWLAPCLRRWLRLTGLFGED